MKRYLLFIVVCLVGGCGRPDQQPGGRIGDTFDLHDAHGDLLTSDSPVRYARITFARGECTEPWRCVPIAATVTTPSGRTYSPAIIEPEFGLIGHSTETFDVQVELQIEGPGHYELQAEFARGGTHASTYLVFEKIDLPHTRSQRVEVERWCPMVEAFSDGFACYQRYSIENEPAKSAFFGWDGQLWHETSDEGPVYIDGTLFWSRQGTAAVLQRRENDQYTQVASVPLPAELGPVEAVAATENSYWVADRHQVVRVDAQTGSVSSLSVESLESERWIGEFATDDRWVFARLDGWNPSRMCVVDARASGLEMNCQAAEGRILAGDRGRFWVYGPDLTVVDYRSGAPMERARAPVPEEFWRLQDTEEYFGRRERFVPSIASDTWTGIPRLGPPGDTRIRFQAAKKDWFGRHATEILQVDGDRIFITTDADGFYKASTVVFSVPVN